MSVALTFFDFECIARNNMLKPAARHEIVEVHLREVWLRGVGLGGGPEQNPLL